MATKSVEKEWRGLHKIHQEVITITKLKDTKHKDSLLHIRAWKKSGTNFAPALNTIYTISPDASPERLGKVVQEVMANVKEKEEWLTK